MKQSIQKGRVRPVDPVLSFLTVVGSSFTILVRYARPFVVNDLNVFIFCVTRVVYPRHLQAFLQFPVVDFPDLAITSRAFGITLPGRLLGVLAVDDIAISRVDDARGPVLFAIHENGVLHEIPGVCTVLPVQEYFELTLKIESALSYIKKKGLKAFYVLFLLVSVCLFCMLITEFSFRLSFFDVDNIDDSYSEKKRLI